MGYATTDCQAVLEKLYLYLDGEIGGEDCAEIDRHLEACTECFGHFGFERDLKAMIRLRCGEADPPAGLIERLRARLRGRDG